MISSSLTKLLVSAALVSTSTASFAQSAPCQGTNCVLPLPGQPAPAPVDTASAEPAPIVEAAEGKGLGLLPLILGAALAGIALYFILDDDEDEEPASP